MRKLLFLFLALLPGAFCYAQLKVTNLLTEDQVNPICIDAAIPRFSWKLDADGRHNVMQAAYEIKVVSYAYLKKNKNTR